MTTKELYDRLGDYIKEGHATTNIIVNCGFEKDGKHYNHLFHNCLNVIYKNGGIEIEVER